MVLQMDYSGYFMAFNVVTHGFSRLVVVIDQRLRSTTSCLVWKRDIPSVRCNEYRLAVLEIPTCGNLSLSFE